MKDNFSQRADLYAKYRPDYPAELFDFLLQVVQEKDRAWDCATGNGQTAKELAKYFQHVDGTDISRKQLDNAVPAVNISYSLQQAEETNFAPDHFNLVTVSQALHWLQFDKFYSEVKRVVKPGGWIAVWMYGLPRISPEINTLVDHYHFTTLEKYWDPERKYVNENYTTVPFPFEEINCPPFQIDYEWTLDEFEGYLRTWSALHKFLAANDHDPVTALVKEIKPRWTLPVMKICFPLHLRMGKVVK